MAKPAKAFKRSARAIERLGKKTSERLDRVQTDIDATTFDANKFAVEAAGQTIDNLSAWLDMFRAVRETPPTLFLDITVSGGGGNVTKGATVTLDETVAA